MMSPAATRWLILCLALLAPLAAALDDPVLYLPLDGDLRDAGGFGNDGYRHRAQFADGHQGQGLVPGGLEATVADTAELRLAPGIQVDCWVKFNRVTPGIIPLVGKDQEYLLRVNPKSEDGVFAFFVVLDGIWEPRVKSEVVPEPGQWYHLEAGWDGQMLSLAVNGKVTKQARTGTPKVSGNPVELGPADAVIDEVKIMNPGAQAAGEAHWSFDGNLNDDTGHGHDLAGQGVQFGQGRAGQALISGPQVQTPDSPDLRLAAGIRISCSVIFDTLPQDFTYLAKKEGEYQLRVDSAKEGRKFSFFVNLGGWEPRVQSSIVAEVGVWYKVIAAWDGTRLTLDVNGQHNETIRSGAPKAAPEPLTLGPIGGRIDDLRIENPRLPVLRCKALTQAETLLVAGRPTVLEAVIENVGSPLNGAIASLALTDGVGCSSAADVPLGTMGTGDAKTVSWTVQAPKPVSATAAITMKAAGVELAGYRRALAFFESTDTPPVPVPQMTGGPATTWYVDSLTGDNGQAGTSPEAAWRDFTNINGKTLGPGDRLLIKRGSVIAQKLDLRAKGTADRWAEIGPYGEGARPILRGKWDIADRCVRIVDPDYLHVHGLTVCFAAKGLVVTYATGGHQGLVIEDCIAHHIEGLYRRNANGIPEWRDRDGAPGDALNSSAGVAVVGAPASDILVRDCEMYQCSWGYFVTGHNATVDRVYVHDEYAHNTSPHPAIVGTKRSFLINSIFDASGWHASAGTMGIMLVDPQGLVIRNCTFRNQPDSGSHDEGGIDFEARGDGCLIDRCTFERNAGAAIEVLGLRSPQVRNLEITNSRFIQNNLANKLGPSEVFIWGRSSNAEVCCSTGSVHGNGYVLNPGVEFFINEAPKTTEWTVENNTAYPTPAALRQAMPFNEPPTVDCGEPIWSASPQVTLPGQVKDDGQPNGKLTVRWEVLEGPGAVKFDDGGKPDTRATFAAPGDYLLRLFADDGELWMSDRVAVHILPAGASTLAAWNFDGIHDKEGWSEVNPGTKLLEFPDPQWPTRAEPVKYVAGNYFILAIEQSTDAALLSADGLKLDASKANTLLLRLQNHTPATQFRLLYATSAGPLDVKRSVTFPVTPNDDAPRVYRVDLRNAPGWTGMVNQLRIDFATGQTLTGTVRTDCVWLGTMR